MGNHALKSISTSIKTPAFSIGLGLGLELKLELELTTNIIPRNHDKYPSNTPIPEPPSPSSHI